MSQRRQIFVQYTHSYRTWNGHFWNAPPKQYSTNEPLALLPHHQRIDIPSPKTHQMRIVLVIDMVNTVSLAQKTHFMTFSTMLIQFIFSKIPDSTVNTFRMSFKWYSVIQIPHNYMTFQIALAIQFVFDPKRSFGFHTQITRWALIEHRQGCLVTPFTYQSISWWESITCFFKSRKCSKCLPWNWPPANSNKVGLLHVSCGHCMSHSALICSNTMGVWQKMPSFSYAKGILDKDTSSNCCSREVVKMTWSSGSLQSEQSCVPYKNRSRSEHIWHTPRWLHFPNEKHWILSQQMMQKTSVRAKSAEKHLSLRIASSLGADRLSVFSSVVVTTLLRFMTLHQSLPNFWTQKTDYGI
jgi:hypothetical protein